MYTRKKGFRIGCGAFISVESEASGYHHQSRSDDTNVRARRFGAIRLESLGFVPGTRIEVITKVFLVVIRS